MQSLRWISTLAACALAASVSAAPAPAAKAARSASPQVEINYMTWPEIYDAIHKQGKTTVLIFNGGTEQRGPQCVLGGHTLVAESVADRVAKQLGNALVAPVLPISPTEVSEEHPGGVTMSAELFTQVNAAVVDSMVKNGFKNIVLLGDHGGGQKQLDELAKAKNEQYAAEGVHVIHCTDNYQKAKATFDDYLVAHHLPLSSHAGIADTSELMYLGGSRYVRADKITVGDPMPKRGERPVHTINNGITGDARGSSPALGKIQIDMKVAAAVAQIRSLLNGSTSTQPR
jgi:creatinine amidohydrolase/Fe(II)-dependent formamide hydrolase-like protein